MTRGIRLGQAHDLIHARLTYLEDKKKLLRARPWRLLSGLISWTQYLRATEQASLSIVTVLVGVLLAAVSFYLQQNGSLLLAGLALVGLVLSALPAILEVRNVRGQKRNLRLVESEHPLTDDALDLGLGIRRAHTIKVFRYEPPPAVPIRRRRNVDHRWRRRRRHAAQPRPRRDETLTEESVYCEYPDLNVALVRSVRGPKVFFRDDERELDANVDQYKSAILLHKYDNRVRPFNGRTVAQLTDITSDFAERGAEVEFAASRYFNLLLGDYLVAQRLVLRNEQVPLDGADLVTRGAEDRSLRALHETKSSNSVGVSTVAFDAEGKLILILQGENAFSSAGLLAPSGSGSLEPRDYDTVRRSIRKREGLADTDEPDVRVADLVTTGMERELAEEANIRTESARTLVTGYFRWLSKGGKPEYCGVTYLDETVGALRRRLSEHRWVRQILVVDVDHEGLKQNPTEPWLALSLSPADSAALKISPAGTISTQQVEAGFHPIEHRLSTPLLVCLRFYGEYLRTVDVVPADMFAS